MIESKVISSRFQPVEPGIIIERVFIYLRQSYLVGPSDIEDEVFFGFHRLLKLEGTESDPPAGLVAYSYKDFCFINYQGRIFFIAKAFPQKLGRASETDLATLNIHILALPLEIGSDNLTNKNLSTVLLEKLKEFYKEFNDFGLTYIWRHSLLEAKPAMSLKEFALQYGKNISDFEKENNVVDLFFRRAVLKLEEITI